jgi:hypothetical protein
MTILLTAIAAYLLLGVAFAIPFAIKGAAAIDPVARHATWGFRLLVIPAAAALWPLLLLRWARSPEAHP